MAKRDSFFITTPIFYVNDVPHIGHGYTEVVSDVLARWHRQRGDDTFLLTGTDEHGQKILRTATANEVTPKQWADRLVESAWKPLLKTLDISNDDFIRTTDQRHEDNVKVFLQRLYDRGFIYTGEFEGYYCVGSAAAATRRSGPRPRPPEPASDSELALLRPPDRPGAAARRRRSGHRPVPVGRCLTPKEPASRSSPSG